MTNLQEFFLDLVFQEICLFLCVMAKFCIIYFKFSNYQSIFSIAYTHQGPMLAGACP